MDSIKLSILLFLLIINCCNARAVSDKVTLQAEQCTQIGARLARLACFDKLFATPLDAPQEIPLHLIERSTVWQRAQLNEQARGTQTGFIQSAAKLDDTQLDIWLTVTDETGAILMLSCLDNITRVELILAQPINLAKVPLAITTSQSLQQTWVVEEDGLIVRGGRGLPAIELIKSMFSAPQIRFNSSVKEFQSYIFDTRQLASAIVPLRQACRW